MRAAALILVTLSAIAAGAAIASGQSTTATQPATTTQPAPAAADRRSPSSAPALGPCLPASSAGRATAPGEAVEPITIQVSPQAQTVAFGGGRSRKEVVVKLSAAAPIPDDVVNRLELVADPILNASDATVSEQFPEPTFSAFRPSRNRKTISFKVCLTPDADLPAGKYISTINLEGPPGVESATITVTATAKDRDLFVAALVVSMLFAAFLLWFRAASDERDRRIAEAEKLPTGTDTEKAAQTSALAEAKKWTPAWGVPVTDPAWLVGSAAALAGAFAAVWAIYTANPSWGDAGVVTSAVAVIGAGLAAVGAKTLISKAK